MYTDLLFYVLDSIIPTTQFYINNISHIFHNMACFPSLFQILLLLYSIQPNRARKCKYLQFYCNFPKQSSTKKLINNLY